jgi:hypothetical protein
MVYDTGCTNLIIFEDELSGLTHLILPMLYPTGIQLASGQAGARSMPIEIRVVSQNNQRVVRDWYQDTAIVIPRSSPNATRLSSKSLNGFYFSCEHPGDKRLCFAMSKTALSRQL